MTDSDDIEKLKNNSIPQHVENSGVPVDNLDNKQGLELSSADSESVPDVDKQTGRGGARLGAGRKKGGMNEESKIKMKVKKNFEERIGDVVTPLFNAELSLALGANYLFWRYKIKYKDKKGVDKFKWSTFEVVKDPEIIADFLSGKFKDSEDQYYHITAEKPDAKAIDSLLDRYFGKAPQSLNIKDDRPDPIATILSKFGLLPDEEESDDDRENTSTEG